MNDDIDYLEDDILEDFGELKELDFGNRKGKTSKVKMKKMFRRKLNTLMKTSGENLRNPGREFHLQKILLLFTGI